MKPPTTLIEAQLLPVVRDLIAEAGDHLIVVHGVCVGVDSARSHRRAAAPLALEHSTQPADKPARKPRLTKAAKAELKKRLNRESVMRTLEALPGGTTKGVTVKPLLDALKLTTEGERAMGGYYLRKLIEEGRITRTEPDKDAPMNLRYRYSVTRDAQGKAA
jgi:hypothetical protein